MQSTSADSSGTPVKPDSSANDTAEVAVIVCYQDASTNYALKFKRDGIYLRGGGWGSDTLLVDSTFGRDDSVWFSVSVETKAVADTLADGHVTVHPRIELNGVEVYNQALSDLSADRVIEGKAGLAVSLQNVENLSSRELVSLRVVLCRIKKTRQE